MERKLVLQAHKNFSGWACSACGWVKPVPRFVESGDNPPKDIDREFQAHDCSQHPMTRKTPREDVNQTAARIVREATAEPDYEVP